jgi:NitT/TauT family transport system substrate-binding protein
LARRDRGVSGPNDLPGKAVGVTSGSSGHFFLSLFLAHNGIEESRVRPVDLEATRLGPALAAGQVDAIATWEPHIHRARKALGDSAVLLPSADIYREDFCFVARKDFIGRRPAALERFLRAVEKGQQSIRADRKAAIDVVGRRLRMDRAELEATWDNFHFTSFLDQSILTSLEDEARWAMEMGLAPAGKAPNYLDFIHADALKAVRPGAVTLAGRRD